MNIHRIARLSVALLALVSFNALAATPPDEQPSPTAVPAITTAPPTAPPPAVQIGNQQTQSAAKESHQAPPAVAAQGASATPKQQAAVVAQAANPSDASGFRLMTLSTNALLSRVSLADQAKHTIDLQYYIFNNDATGRLIALHLLQAADRGVHVRILIDDLNLVDETRMFRALDSHPNIEVKLFNPFSSPHPSVLSRFAQLVLEFRRLNRRMHDKSFIVDNDVAVIGGRNIGDPYFDASSDNNFRDLDVLAIGPVVPAATRSFEAYWNSAAARPISELQSKPDQASTDPEKPDSINPDSMKPGSIKPDSIKTSIKPDPTDTGSTEPDPAIDLAAVRASLEKDARTFDQSAYKQEAADDLPNGAAADRPGNWFWGHATLVADAPEKIENGSDRKDLRISPELQATIKNAQSEVLLISPYFVPSKPEERNFIALAQRGVAFKVLTNSLASTDEVPVHAGYSGHRRALLEGGVQLFELKPAAGAQMAATDVGRSSGASLHAKAFVVDERYVFIGSLNMDQRSKLLNTEMGVVVDSPQLAKAVAGFFATATTPANAYHVVLGARDGSHPSEMHWETSKDGKDVDYASEPDANFKRHAEVLLMKLLPIDGLL